MVSRAAVNDDQLVFLVRLAPALAGGVDMLTDCFCRKFGWIMGICGRFLERDVYFGDGVVASLPATGAARRSIRELACNRLVTSVRLQLSGVAQHGRIGPDTSKANRRQAGTALNLNAEGRCLMALAGS